MVSNPDVIPESAAQFASLAVWNIHVALPVKLARERVCVHQVYDTIPLVKVWHPYFDAQIVRLQTAAWIEVYVVIKSKISSIFCVFGTMS